MSKALPQEFRFRSDKASTEARPSSLSSPNRWTAQYPKKLSDDVREFFLY